MRQRRVPLWIRAASWLILVGLVDAYCGGHHLALAYARERRVEAYNARVLERLGVPPPLTDEAIAERKAAARATIRETRAALERVQARNLEDLRAGVLQASEVQRRADLEGLSRAIERFKETVQRVLSGRRGEGGLVQDGRTLWFLGKEIRSFTRSLSEAGLLSEAEWTRSEVVLSRLEGLGDHPRGITAEAVRAVAADLADVIAGFVDTDRRRHAPSRAGGKRDVRFPGVDPLTGKVKPGPRRSNVLDRLEPPEVLPERGVRDLAARWAEIPGARMRPAGAPQEAPTEEDLAETLEVRFTSDIQALAAELNHDPLQIFNYVRTTIDYRIYAGSVYGAQGALDARAGNDVDQASLLIALLRASGFPARYESGFVLVPAADFAEMTGIQDPNDAASAMYTMGVPTTVVYGATTQVKTWRTWVQAYVPYTSYRGQIDEADQGGRPIWIRLDPSIKQYEIEQQYDFSDDVSFDVDGFLSQPVSTSALAYYEDLIREHIRTTGSGCETVDQALARLVNHAAPYQLLPSVLPFPVDGDTTVTADLDDSVRYQVHLSATDWWGFTLFGVTLTLPEIYGKRLAFTFPSGSGIYSAASGTVTPTLSLDGDIVVQGGGVAVGTEVPLLVEMDGPGTPANLRNHPCVAGGTYVVSAWVGPVPKRLISEALEEWHALESSGAPQAQVDLAIAEAAGLTYHDHLVTDDDRIWGLNGWLGFSEYEALAGTDTGPIYMWGFPAGAVTSGYMIDAENYVFAMPLRGGFSYPALARIYEIAGYNGSFYEQKIWSELLDLGAFSSTSALQLARQEGQTIHFLETLDDYNAVAGELSHDNSVINDVTNALSAGETVVISDRPVTRGDKTCSGYVLFDPERGTGKYLIYTRLNGGSTFDWREALEEFYEAVGELMSIFSWANVSTGSLVDSPGPLVVFADGRAKFIKLAYSSLQDRPSDLGLGWNWSFGDRLFEDPNTGDVVWLNGVAAQTEYTRNDDGTYFAPPDIAYRLETTSEGWSITSSNGTVIHFDTQGRFTRQVDRYGNAVVLIRDTNGFPTRLETGRGALLLTLASDDEGHITSMTDPTGRTLTMSYTDGRLTHFEDSSGKQWDYVYGVGPELIGKIDGEGTVISYGYDGDGRLARHSTPSGAEGTFAYDHHGRQVAWTNPVGARHLLTLNEEGRLVTYIDPVGNRYDYEYENGRRVRITSSRGTEETARYDDQGHMIEHVAPDGATRTRTYDEQGRKTSETDSSGTRTWVYDDASNTVTETDVDGVVTVKTYDERGLLLSETTSGATTRYEYDANGNRIAEIDPTGTRLTYEVDAAGRPTATTSESGMTLQTTLDGAGRLTHAELPDGTTFDVTFTSLGYPETITNFDGRTMRYTYQGHWLMSITDFQGHTTTYQRDDAGNVVSTSDYLGNVTRYTVDAAGRVVTYTDIHGNTTELNYCADIRANPCDIIDPQGNLIQRTFDEMGRIVQETSALGTTTYEYAQCTSSGCNGQGRLAAVVDRLGNRTEYLYNARGLLATVIDALGNATYYEYDHNDRLTSVTDPAGATTQYLRDGAGRIVEILDALGRTVDMTYDEDGIPVTMTDPNGHTTTYLYDDLGRPAGKILADGTTESLSYDSRGLLIRAVNPNSDEEYRYDDPLNRLTAVVNHTLEQSISITYDPVTGKRATITRADGTTSYAYNQDAQVSAVTLPDGQVIRFFYDRFGRLSEKRFPNGTREVNTYDEWNRLTARLTYNKDGILLAGFAYTYDALNRRASTTDINGVTTTYAYDPLGRLIEERTGTDVRTYAYDAAGNRLSVSENGEVVTTYSYDATHRLLSMTDHGVTTNFSYDANGNLVSRTDGSTTTTFAYDGANRLVEVQVPGVPVNRFKYDALGRRVYRTGSGGEAWTLYLAEDALLELDGAGNLVRGFVHGEGIDNPLALLDHGDTGNAYFYHTDALGSVIAMSGPGGEVANAYSYGSFGELQVTQATVTNDYTFTGRRHDADIDSYHFRARQYDPKLGRFLQPDPRTPSSFEQLRTSLAAAMPAMADTLEELLSIPQALNPYAYVMNNPLNLVDPSGEGICDAASPIPDLVMSLTDAFGLLAKVMGEIASFIVGVLWGIFGAICTIIQIWQCDLTLDLKILATLDTVLLLAYAIVVGLTMSALGAPLVLVIIVAILLWLLSLVWGLIIKSMGC